MNSYLPLSWPIPQPLSPQLSPHLLSLSFQHYQHNSTSFNLIANLSYFSPFLLYLPRQFVVIGFRLFVSLFVSCRFLLCPRFLPGRRLLLLCELDFLFRCFLVRRFDLRFREILFLVLLLIILNFIASLNLYPLILFLCRFRLIIVRHLVF